MTHHRELLMRACKFLSAAICVLSLVSCNRTGAEPSSALPPPASKLICAPITLPVIHGALGGAVDAPSAVYDWQGDWQSCEVIFPSKLFGSALYAVLHAPANIDLAHDKLPVVVIAPGSISGVQSQYQWSARELAANGYITLVIDPQGVGNSELVSYPQTADNYIDAVVSGLDFIESDANPLRANVDTAHMGAAGHSLSASGLSWLQAEDLRLQAIVAWDNLAENATGAAEGGQLVGGEIPSVTPLRPVRPRVPAMGQANSDGQATNPDDRKKGYELWHQAGVSSMLISFLGKGHLDWAQGQRPALIRAATNPRRCACSSTTPAPGSTCG